MRTGISGLRGNLAMYDRSIQIDDFLRSSGFANAVRKPLAGDASFRRYERIDFQGKSLMLMDAPPPFEDIGPFVAIGEYLKSNGLAAPEIKALDQKSGFLLLEDLGDDLFAQVIRENPSEEGRLYALAIDGLLHLHQHTPEQKLSGSLGVSHRLPHYDQILLLREVALLADWYIPALKGKRLSVDARAGFMALWTDILHPVAGARDCLVLRDYHAENLMLRAGQQGLDALGLIDFQDAVLGHAAYDLQSLLMDARRDMPLELEEKMIQRFLAGSNLDEDGFRRDYAILAAQRNVKIIGIFSRLFLRDGKDNYLKLLPRVWGLLERALEHPALAPLKLWLDREVPQNVRRKTLEPKPLFPAQAMILAAGLGRRMMPLTAQCPKPLITVKDKPILARTLDNLVDAGVLDVVINTHYLADQMEDFITGHYDKRIKFSLSDERDELLDSGGGVKKALPHLGDDAFYVLNSDMIWQDRSEGALHTLSGGWQEDAMDMLLLLVPTQKAVGYEGVGDFHLAADGRLTPRGNDAQADHMYGGIMILKADCFKDSPEGPFSLRLLFQKSVQQGRLYGMVFEGDWYHVGTPEARDEIEKLISQ